MKGKNGNLHLPIFALVLGFSHWESGKAVLKMEMGFLFFSGLRLYNLTQLLKF